MKKILSLLALLVYLPLGIHTSKVMSQEVAKKDGWDIACKSGSTEDYISEVSLISAINLAKINAEEGLKNLTDIELELNNYSKQVDTTGKVLTFLVNDWDGTVRSMLEGFVSESANIPGIEIKKLELEANPVKALEKILAVFDTLSPSNIADWITQASLTIANAKLQITSSAAQKSTILSQELKTLRDKCKSKAKSNPNHSMEGICKLIEPGKLKITVDKSELILTNPTNLSPFIIGIKSPTNEWRMELSPFTTYTTIYTTKPQEFVLGFYVKPGFDREIVRDKIFGVYPNQPNLYMVFNTLVNLPCVSRLVVPKM